MSKLLTALIAAGFSLGLTAVSAQNVDSDKDKAQGQDKIMHDKEQGAKKGATTSQQGQPSDNKKTTGNAGQANKAKSAKSTQDCSKLSGKEHDKCKQATPAGVIDVRTGEESKSKSTDAKIRDREQTNQADTNAPVQSNSAVGKPAQGATTGEGKTGTGGQSAKHVPDQSKGTVGHPEQRTTTGEGQSGQEPGAKTSKNPN
ncbi:MAG: hypothetical protein ABI612_14455 [Betaproteobacteria bacterium]